MKTLLTLLIALAAGSLAAQSQHTETPNATGTGRPSRESVATQPQRNNVVLHKVTYEGFFPELVRAKNPLEVINPFAPQKENEDNVIHDRDNKSLGVKLLTIRF
jgi:hypothetical protein